MSRHNRLNLAWLCVASALSPAIWTGCTTQGPAPAPQEVAPVQDSLYRHIGGHEALAHISDAWIDRVVADSQLKARFTATDLPAFKARMTTLLCSITGGPEAYLGKDMKSAHRGMNISDAEWTAFLDDLKAVLDDLKIPALDREELLVKIEPMKASIVGQ